MSGRTEGGRKGAILSTSRTSTYQTAVILGLVPRIHAGTARIKPDRPSTHSISASRTLHPPQSPESHGQAME